VRALDQWLGWKWIALIAGVAALGVVEGQPALLAVLAGLVALRLFWRWTGARAQDRHLRRLTGDPAVYHEHWLYLVIDPVAPGERKRCGRCRTRLEPGAATVEGFAMLPEAEEDLPAILGGLGDRWHAGAYFCEACGADFRGRQGDEEARAEALLAAGRPRALAEPDAGLRRKSAVALALSGAGLVLLPSPGLGPVIVLLLVVCASLFGLAIARHGWDLYADNPALLAFLAIALAGLMVPAAITLSSQSAGDPLSALGPGAIKVEFVSVTPEPPDAHRLALLTHNERAQDLLAETLVAMFEARRIETTWWRDEALVSTRRLTRLQDRHSATAALLEHPALRRRYAEIAATRQEWVGHVGAIREAMARGSVGGAMTAEISARLAADKAARLRWSLIAD